MNVTCALCTKNPAAVCFENTTRPLCVSCAREDLFAKACKAPSDINEHLPLLRELAAQCTHVTEFGTRWGTGSTIAFIAAQPKTFVAWDLDAGHMLSPRIDTLYRLAGDTRFQPRVGNTLEITIEPTDLLFIDTLHTAKQLLHELERHCDPKHQRVRKFLAFHDTSTFGMVGEDGQPPGLRTAIRQFQKYFAFPLWCLMHELENNNGLIVLKHVCADGHSLERTGKRCNWCGQIPEPPL